MTHKRSNCRQGRKRIGDFIGLLSGCSEIGQRRRRRNNKLTKPKGEAGIDRLLDAAVILLLALVSRGHL